MLRPVDPLSRLTSDLTENGLAFLHRSVAEMSAQTATVRTLSFAVVDLAAAVEVLMKARLVREHWTLICADPDKATPAQMLAGTAKTVTPEQAIKRLEGAAGVAMTSGGHEARVRDLVTLRNRAIHFAMVGIATAGLQSSLGRGLDFVLWFLNSEFRGHGDPAVEEMVEDSIDTLTTQVGQLKALVAERLASIGPELANAELCVECPRCRQSTLMLLDGETSRCGFCLWKPVDGEECAAEYADVVLGLSYYEAVKDGGDWPVHVCTNCGADSMIEGIQQLRPDPSTMNAGEPPCDWISPAHWGCFSCGSWAGRTGIEHCTRCGVPTVMGSDDGVPVCSDCWADITHD
jgi:hypothetical protein